MTRYEFFKDTVVVDRKLTLYLRIARWYMGSLSKSDRMLRLIFIGRRLQIKQYRWLHDHNHPWEYHQKD